MRNYLTAFTVSIVLLASPAQAAKFFYTTKSPMAGAEVFNSAGALVLSGDIVEGDYDRLLSVLSKDVDRYLVNNTIVLASNGGDVSEALKIAKLIKSLLATVVVGPFSGPCVSACFLIYAGSNIRMAAGDDVLGIHRPYIVQSQMAALPPLEAESAENRVLRETRGYLQENNVPIYLVEEMFRRASNDVYWLSAQDIEELGTRSHWFDQYLVAKCGWDTGIERDLFRGDEQNGHRYGVMMACLNGITRPAARKALFLAFKTEVDREGDRVDPRIRLAYTTEYTMNIMKKMPQCHLKGVSDQTTDECPDFDSPSNR
jgi:hypothetical protein